MNPEEIHAIDEDMVRTRSGIEIPSPDQGYRVVYLRLDVPGSTGLIVYEGEKGDDLDGFLTRWNEWLRSEEEYLPFVEPRFGFRHWFPRSLIPRVLEIGWAFVPRADTRAPVQQQHVQGVVLDVPAHLLRRGRRN